MPGAGTGKRKERGPEDEFEDRGLMERIQADGPGALDALLQKYWHGLVAYAARMVPGEDAAEDIAQEAVFRLWRGRKEWRPSDRLSSYLYRITRNLALDDQRRRRLRDHWWEEQVHQEMGSVPTPLQLAERREVSGAVALAIEALPVRRREVFVLSRYHGHSYREIGTIMGISPQTVANQMSAALEQLREALEPHLQEARAASDPGAGSRFHALRGREDERAG